LPPPAGSPAWSTTTDRVDPGQRRPYPGRRASTRRCCRYADALTGGDLPGIAACYALARPGGRDAATIPVSEPAQVEAAFGGAGWDTGRLGIQVVIDITLA
jgi:hypothetical protein